MPRPGPLTAFAFLVLQSIVIIFIPFTRVISSINSMMAVLVLQQSSRSITSSVEDNDENDVNDPTMVTTISRPFEMTKSPLHTSIPDLVYLQSQSPSHSLSDCDACPFCKDVCLNDECRTCIKKTKLMNERRRCSSTDPFRLFPGHPRTNEEEVYITPCELKRHNTSDSAWLLCGEIVYDATNFINGHPGGEKSILRKAGGAVDCTKDMKFHSSKAINMWKRNKIGVLRTCRGEHGLVEDQDENVESCVIS